MPKKISFEREAILLYPQIRNEIVNHLNQSITRSKINVTDLKQRLDSILTDGTFKHSSLHNIIKELKQCRRNTTDYSRAIDIWRDKNIAKYGVSSKEPVAYRFPRRRSRKLRPSLCIRSLTLYPRLMAHRAMYYCLLHQLAPTLIQNISALV